MIFKKHLFLIVTAFLTTLLCSCYSNKSLNYNYGEAEGYRFYQGFYSSFSDGTNQKQLFEFIKIDNVDYTIMVDNITTFYYEDHVACIYEYSDNQYAFINYDIKNEKANLIETYTSNDVRFIVPNYYPVFYTKDSNGDVDSYTYHLYYQSQIISSDYELQSINSYGYFSLSKDNTLFISFSSNNTSEFKNGYRAVYNVSNLKTVYLYDERDIQSEIISFDCLSLEKQEIETNSFGQIEK